MYHLKKFGFGLFVSAALLACQSDKQDCVNPQPVPLLNGAFPSRTQMIEIQDNPNGFRITLQSGRTIEAKGECPAYGLQTLSGDYTHLSVKGKAELNFHNERLFEFVFTPEQYEAYLVALCDKAGMCVEDNKYILHKGVRVQTQNSGDTLRQVVFSDDCFMSQLEAAAKKCQ